MAAVTDVAAPTPTAAIWSTLATSFSCHTLLKRLTEHNNACVGARCFPGESEEWKWEWVGGGGLPTRADVAAGSEKNVSTCVDGVGAINHLMINVLTLGRNQKKPPSS